MRRISESKEGKLLKLWKKENLDHFLMSDAEGVLVEQGDHDGMLAVCVDACPGTTHAKRIEEQRRALGLLEPSLGSRALKVVLVHVGHEHVVRLDALLLNPRGRNVDLFPEMQHQHLIQ